MNTAVIESRTFNLPVDNIDTDQIIPASFLTTTERSGLGRACFHAWRFNEDGSEKPDNPLREHRVAEQAVLVAGENFGCGSSREHAPWALLDYGFRAVISSRFADIFRNNALKNGLLPIVVDEDTHRQLFDQFAASPDAEVSCGFRPEHLRLGDPDRTTLQAEVVLVERLGDHSLVTLALDHSATLTAKVAAGDEPPPGTRVGVSMAATDGHLFDPDGVACPRVS